MIHRINETRNCHFFVFKNMCTLVETSYSEVFTSGLAHFFKFPEMTHRYNTQYDVAAESQLYSQESFTVKSDF